jgi:hypothetical protein
MKLRLMGGPAVYGSLGGCGCGLGNMVASILGSSKLISG